MTQTSVSNTVLSIIASFTGGLDVFKRLRKRRLRRTRDKTSNRTDEDELRLSRSLRRGPDDISREYQRSVQYAGDQFAVGDATAQTSLAEILLKLNTGLVSIITSFLHRDKDKFDIDYRSLADLSESSRVDTLGTLRSLLQRTIDSRHHVPKSLANVRAESVVRGKPQQGSKPYRKTKKPRLARVVIKDSSRPSRLALVKASTGGGGGGSGSSVQGRTQSTPVPATASSTEGARTGSSPALIGAPATQAEPPIAPPIRPRGQRAKTAPNIPKVKRKQSATDWRHRLLPDTLRTTRSTPRLRPSRGQNAPRSSTPPPPAPQPPAPTYLATEEEPRPPHLGRPPTSVQQEVVRRRKLTPTFYSTATDGTKVGEIPMHRWAVPFDFDAASIVNREAAGGHGWTGRDHDGANGVQGEKNKGHRVGLFGLFRRRTSEQSS